MGSSPIDFPACGYKFFYLLAEKSCATNLHLFVQICVQKVVLRNGLEFQNESVGSKIKDEVETLQKQNKKNYCFDDDDK